MLQWNHTLSRIGQEPVHCASSITGKTAAEDSQYGIAQTHVFCLEVGISDVHVRLCKDVAESGT